MWEDRLADVTSCCSIKFERIYGHSIEDVFAAVADQDSVSDWIGYLTTIEPSVGGRVSIDFSPEESLEGVVCAYQPYRLLSFTWGDGLVTWLLEATDEGTRLTFSQSGIEPEHVADFAAGWHAFIDHLGPHLDGEDVPDRFDVLFELYRRRETEGLKPAPEHRPPSSLSA